MIKRLVQNKSSQKARKSQQAPGRKNAHATHTATHLSVRDDGDPVRLRRSGYGQHGPEEDGDGVEHGQDAGRHEVVENHREVADEL